MRYRIKFSKEMLTVEELDEIYLRDNWELITILREAEGYYYHFKREEPNE